MAVRKKTGKYYVYALIDPRDESVFYIGKGTGRRSTQHVRNSTRGTVDNLNKHNRIVDILASSLKVKERIIADGLSEPEALSRERAEIASIGLESLTNAICGQTTEVERSKAHARQMLKRIIPFHVWCQGKSDPQIQLYHGVVAEYQKMAKFGFDRKIISRRST